MLYREALKTGCYDLQKARDTYRSFVQEEGIHRDLFLQYSEVNTAHNFQWDTWELYRCLTGQLGLAYNHPVVFT